MKTNLFKWFVALFVCMIPAALFTACSDDDDDEPKTQDSALTGKWYGTVYEDGESLDDYVTVVLGSDMSYKDYNSKGQLIGSGSYSYSGNTITIPSGYIGDDWGKTYTVTISGNKMTWTNSTMKQWNCEYRFVKQ